MKFKLDENRGCVGLQVLQAAGHDVAMVFEQGLAGKPDPEVIQVCQAEQRCLVTMDAEFGNPLMYDARAYFGIALLRPPANQTLAQILQCMDTLAAHLRSTDITGRLWIVEIGRVREYQPDN